MAGGGRSGWAKILLTAGLALTATVALYTLTMAYANDRAEATVRERAADLGVGLRTNVERYAQAALSGRGLFAASNSVERGEWAAYVAALDLGTNYPGAIGFAYVQAVEPDAFDDFLERTRADDAPWFAVRPASASDPGPRFILKYHEPEARNRSAIGFDLSSRPTVASSYRHARDTATLTLSEPTRLLQEMDKGMGVVMMLPIYRTGFLAQSATVAERRAAHQGWVALPLLLDELFQASWAAAYRDMAVLLRDGSTVLTRQAARPASIREADAEPAATNATPPPTAGWVTYTERIEIGGRAWDLQVRGEPVLLPEHVWLARVVLLCGLLLTATLTLVAWSLNRTRSRAVTIARQMTTELRAQAEELESARATAEAANVAKSQFLANMSHEIRTPMTAILGFADLLAAPDVDDAERRAHVSVIQRNGRHLLAIINDILDLSKIEAGMMQVERVDTPVREFVDEVASLLRVRAEGKGLTLDVTVEPDVPDRVRTDPVRLRQVLVNLLGNAIKFTQAGSVRVHVRLQRGSRGGRWLRFEVVDTGIGISGRQLGRLFTPFAQADSSMTRRFGGTGLGLAVSKRLAAMLGGDITVTSQPGVGSRFVMTIDAADALADAPPTTPDPAATPPPAPTTPQPDAANLPATPPAPATPSPTAPAPTMAEPEAEPEPDTPPEPIAADPASYRVLLVEDGEDNRRLVGYMLRKAGYTVDLAEHGREGVERARSGEPYAVVLMDMQMPVMDGYTAAGELRRAGYDRPIVALTAHAMTGDRERCVQAGCDDYLSKPVDLPAMLATLQRWRDRRSDHAGTPAAAA
jgi:signal transduction histidine kinase/ActR/RegA family two-component response regulator